MNRRRNVVALLALALVGGSSALAVADPGGGQYGADNVGKHGKQPIRHTPVIDHGPLPAPSRIAPVPEQSFAATPKRGRVLVRAGGGHGPGAFMQLTGDLRLPVGAVIDASHGVVALTVARGAVAKPQVIELTGGLFIVRQHGRNPVTDIVLTGGNFARCRGRARAAVAGAAAVRRSRRRSPHSVVRRLWARDDHGRFMTYGLTSVATVRGTLWLTQDRCDGTLTRVYRGRVAVRDRMRRRTIVVTAGHRYLAARR
jgi:hypothetical protein